MVLRLLWFSATLIVLVHCQSDGECGKALMNGTQIQYFPWHAGIYNHSTVTREYTYVCGAALISPKLLISAAHCFDRLMLNSPQPLAPKKRFSVALGKVYKDWDAKEDAKIHKSRVSKVAIPRTYGTGQHLHWESDVAVVELETPASSAPNIGPICLDPLAYLTEGQNVQVAGWGLGDQPLEGVGHVDLPSLLYRECIRRASVSFSSWVTRDKFCSIQTLAQVVHDSGLDGGTSGSAVMAEHGGKWYIHGVVSSRDLADSHYVFTNVTFPDHLQWIRNVTGTWSKKA